MTAKELESLKTDMLGKVNEWANGRIDDLVASNPGLKKLTPWIKRYIKNSITRNDLKLDKVIDHVSLLACDDNGNVDIDTLFDDVMSMFKEMDDTPFKWGVFKGSYGKGRIRIEVPENPLMNILFGDIGAVTVTTDDIMEFKNMIITDK